MRQDQYEIERLRRALLYVAEAIIESSTDTIWMACGMPECTAVDYIDSVLAPQEPGPLERLMIYEAD